MTIQIKKVGIWRDIGTIQTRVGGVWKDVNTVETKVDGVWETVWPTGFPVTVLGDSIGVQSTDYCVSVVAEDEQEGNSNADADTDIWVESTSNNVSIRVAGAGNGNFGIDRDWYNPAHVSQGVPDTDRTPGTTVFLLGQREGVTVNIYTIRANEPDGLNSIKIGSFTDDDKSTFFAPTDGVQYGYAYNADADDPPGVGETDWAFDYSVRQFTFRKDGFDDYTITMGTYVEAAALDST
jgi:hypothetical protein